MTRSALIIAAFLLSACSGPFGKPRVTTPYKFGDKGDLVDFNYAWSAEASAIPALEKHFRAQLDKAWREELAAATADRASAAAAKRNYAGHQFSFDWNTAGRARRLLSLEGLSSTLTGDLHPSHGSAALLWDRGRGAIVTPSALLTAPARLSALLHADFCKGLARERAKRRAVTPRDAVARPCPAIGKVTLVPSDTNANARFDALRLTADHDVAGSYAEGVYLVVLPVTRAFIAALKPVYRSSFEVAQPQ